MRVALALLPVLSVLLVARVHSQEWLCYLAMFGNHNFAAGLALE